MDSGNAPRPIIIKRKRIILNEDASDSSWKIAYADFVTALMAFFMVLWLLSSTSEDQRRSIAQYFRQNVTVSKAAQGGTRIYGGGSELSHKTLAPNAIGLLSGSPHHLQDTLSSLKKDQETATLQRDKQKVDEMLVALAGESDLATRAAKHIVTKVTERGLEVVLYDRTGAPLFVGAQVQPITRTIAGIVAEMSKATMNPISVGSHLSARPIVQEQVSPWQVSAARAQTFRRLLEEQGLHRTRIARTVVHADREPIVQNPMAERNNRIELIYLRQVN